MGCDIHVHVECKRNILKWDHIDIDLIPYRNYNLFTTLAGVRSYSNNNIPISEPKGMPNYISNETKEDLIDMFDDAHSLSWLTLYEIKKYNNKKPKIFNSGLVDEQGAKSIEQGLSPEWYCQGSNNNSYVFREWIEYNNTLEPIIEQLEIIKYERSIFSDNDIRIVFWFDN